MELFRIPADGSVLIIDYFFPYQLGMVRTSKEGPAPEISRAPKPYLVMPHKIHRSEFYDTRKFYFS